MAKKKQLRLKPIVIVTDNGEEEIQVENIKKVVFTLNEIIILSDFKKGIISKDKLTWTDWDAIKIRLRVLFEGIEE